MTLDASALVFRNTSILESSELIPFLSIKMLWLGELYKVIEVRKLK